jgi:hypothetical protein
VNQVRVILAVNKARFPNHSKNDVIRPAAFD